MLSRKKMTSQNEVNWRNEVVQLVNQDKFLGLNAHNNYKLYKFIFTRHETGYMYIYFTLEHITDWT